MNIDSIQPSAAPFEPFEIPRFDSSPGAPTSFASLLGKNIDDVNALLLGADAKNVEMAVGRAENLHEATIAIEKAETALRLMTQVRNKALDAYNEILRMQL